MATTQKALELALELQEALKARLPALTVAAVSFDSAQNPLIQIGAGTAGAAGGLVRVKPIDWALGGKDIVGGTRVFCPHVIQIGLEANYAATNDNIADVNTLANLAIMFCELAKRGTLVEMYQTANGTAPVVASLDDATLLKASIPTDLRGSMTGWI